MGRLSTLEDTAIFDAVGQHLASHGSIRLQDIVAATGVSVGSLYHRYGSREALLAATWIDAVETFQVSFFKALTSKKSNAGELAAMATPRFCRSQPARARILVCCRRAELLSIDLPDALKLRIAEINDAAAVRLLRFAKENEYSVDACRLALVAFPLGAVKAYMPHAKVPKAVDRYVAAAYKAVVAEDKKK